MNSGDNKIKDKRSACQRMKINNMEIEEDMPTLSKPVV